MAKARATPEAADRVTVPLIVDALRSIEEVPMARCFYFVVEAEDTGEVRALELTSTAAPPLLMVGASAVVHRGTVGQETFSRARDIEELFRSVEEHPDLSIHDSDLYLPAQLLSSGTEVPPSRGDVYRAGVELFRAARRYTAQGLTLEAFLGLADDLAGSVRVSPEETDAFRLWNEEQIRDAIRIYPKSEALELGWRED